MLASDMSARIDTNKTSGLRECVICNYWYFLETNFRFEPRACGGCHDLMQKAMNFNYVATVSDKGICFIFILLR